MLVGGRSIGNLSRDLTPQVCIGAAAIVPLLGFGRRGPEVAKISELRQ